MIRRPRHTSALRRLLVLALGMTAGIAVAGDLYGARFRFRPEKPFVGQAFEVTLEMEVSPGADPQDLQLEGVPLDTYAALGVYQKGERRQERRGDRVVDVLSLRATGRATQAARLPCAGILRATLLERRVMGFFSAVQTQPVAARIAPFTLEFRPRPAAGVPPGYGGAVGVFALAASVEPAQAAPNDLVTLTYTLSGDGCLNGAHLLWPAPDPNFRVYPPQEIHRDENGKLTVRQVVVPLNSNAVQLAAARLPYFDPVAEIYREAASGPLRLRLVARQEGAPVAPVKHLDIQTSPPTAVEVNDAAVSATLAQLRHLLPFGGVLLLAMLLVGACYGRRPRLAIVAGVLVFALGVYFCRRWEVRSQPRGRIIAELSTARLCPSANARLLFQIPPGREVIPLELADDWVRVDSEGRRGWIPTRALK
jgi:hypothetical protein